jgi:hypothetical protein
VSDARLAHDVRLFPNLVANLVDLDAGELGTDHLGRFLEGLLALTKTPRWISAPFWTVKKEEAKAGIRFTLTPPATGARELDLIVTLGDRSRRRGELYFRCPMTD